MYDTAAILALVGIGAILLHIATNLKEEHVFLQMLFFFSGFGMFIVSINFVGGIVPDALARNIMIAFYTMIMMTFIAFVYFAIYFITQNLKTKRSRKKEEEGLEY